MRAGRMRLALLTTGRHDLSYVAAIHKKTGGIIITAEPDAAFNDLDAAMEAAMAAQGAASALSYRKPDALLVVGDRTETLAVCVAATCMKIPIAHVHGGDITLGAIDNVCRHAISQLARWHFCAHEEAASVLRSMSVPGEIHMTGSPSIDLLMAKKRERMPGADIVFSYHPETLSGWPIRSQIEAAAEQARARLKPGGKIICTGANPDAGGKDISGFLRALGDPFIVRDQLDSESFWDLLSTCDCFMGNSSSGVIEAPVLGVPWIEIGDRQKGRYRGPYGDGMAADRIAAVLAK